MVEERDDPGTLLATNRADLIAATTRSLFGAVPFVGTALAEVISHHIPNQRSERVHAFLIELDARLRKYEGGAIAAALNSTEGYDLIDAAVRQAALHRRGQRAKHLATIVAGRCRGREQARDSSSNEQIDPVELTFLDVLDRLTDREVLLLRGAVRTSQQTDAEAAKDPFRLEHPDIDAELSGGDSHELSEEEQAFRRLRKQHLVEAGVALPDLDDRSGIWGVSFVADDVPITRMELGEQLRQADRDSVSSRLARQEWNQIEVTTLGVLLLKALELLPEDYKRR